MFNTTVHILLWQVVATGIVGAAVGILCTVLTVYLLGRKRAPIASQPTVEAPEPSAEAQGAEALSLLESQKQGTEESDASDLVGISGAGRVELNRRAKKYGNYKVAEVALLLGVSVPTVNRWLSRGELRSVMMPDRMRWVTAASIVRLLDRLGVKDDDQIAREEREEEEAAQEIRDQEQQEQAARDARDAVAARREPVRSAGSTVSARSEGRLRIVVPPLDDSPVRSTATPVRQPPASFNPNRQAPPPPPPNISTQQGPGVETRRSQTNQASLNNLKAKQFYWYYVDNKPDAYATLREAIMALGMTLATHDAVAWDKIGPMLRNRIKRVPIAPSAEQ